MIYCYSATGNTRYAAEYLGKKLGEAVYDLLDENSPLPDPGTETVGFMFPIYCWGIPPVVSRFLERVFPLIPRNAYVWGACTCGDEAGTAMKTFDKLLSGARGRKADALWSVIMPNTYVMLPGFDVDKEEVERRKLQEAPSRLDRIAEAIRARDTGVYDVTEGSLPALRSAIFPIFEKWGVTAKWWHVSEACIGCGKCAMVCPARNITMDSGRPRWGTDCYSCCACYHCCTVHAISYNRFTRGKSQYHGPQGGNS